MGFCYGVIGCWIIEMEWGGEERVEGNFIYGDFRLFEFKRDSFFLI